MARLLTRSILVTIILAAVIAILLRYYSARNLNVVQAASARTVKITYNFTISDIPPQAQLMRIWVPVPPTNDHQQLHDINVSGDWSSRIVNESQFGNKFLVFDINSTKLAGSSEAVFTIKFRVTRYAVLPQSKGPSARIAPQDEPGRYLAPDRLIPVDGKIAAEARQVAGHIHNPLKQARLLYDHIVSTVRYDKSGIGWGRGDALYACDIRTGNCSDFHSLFIGQARALGIPARFIMGLPLPEDKIEGIIPSYHCWGEFYLPEKGWCPVDASEASKFPQKKERFFCGLDEHRVAFTTGRDINLPGAKSEPLNFVIYPHVEIDGLPHVNVQTTFSFKDCPPTTNNREKVSWIYSVRESHRDSSGLKARFSKGVYLIRKTGSTPIVEKIFSVTLAVELS